MAQIPVTKEPTPLTINQFLGLNMPQAGDTQINLGESGNMYNCYVTSTYDLSKANGYKQLITQVANKPIKGMWNGILNGKEYFLFAINGHLYKFDDDYWKDDSNWGVWSEHTTDLGTITEATTNFFEFSGKVYIQNGAEYKSYDGTTLADVTGYIPKAFIGCNPITGDGTEYELLNLLTGKKHCTYNPDGTATYKLPEASLNSIDYVYVDGVLKTLTTHYTVNLSAGTITFTSGNIPVTGGLDNVDIYWTKGTGNRDLVYKNMYNFIYGANRVFLYGNEDAKNNVIYSALANGVPSAEYFTAFNTMPVGNANSYVTGLDINQTMILVYKDKPYETYYANYDITNLDGIDTVNFPVTVINGARGNCAIGQSQVINNYPVTLDTELVMWIPTTVKDERNAKPISKRIQKDLNDIDLSKCLMIDKQNTNELWISNGKKVWIYNYDLGNPVTKEKGIYSRLYLDNEPTCWLLIDGNLFFGTTTGKIMKISDEYLTYNGHAIDSHWEMNMYDFGANYLVKNMINAWLQLAAQPKANVDVQYVTNKNAYGTVQSITYNTATFNDVDFANFTFYTNYNPQTFNIRLRAIGFTNIKLVLDNTSATSTFVILSISLKAEYGSEVR